MSKKKVAVVVAHPDDEVIFLWPGTFWPNSEVHVLTLSNDRYNDQRPGRAEAFQEVADTVGFRPHQLDHACEFARLPHRPDNKLGRWWDDACRAIADVTAGAAAVFTHNPHGEYGHTDHQLVFQTVLGVCRSPVMVTDIRLPGCGWPLAREGSPAYVGAFHDRRVSYQATVEPWQMEKIQAARAIYKRRGAWTWDFDLPVSCTVYRLNNPS